MKPQQIFLVGYILSISLFSHSQVSEPYGSLLFEDTLTLDPMYDWISIPSEETNIWQVGRTNKDFLFESNLQYAVIVTDTLNSYPVSLDDYFLISIPENENSWSWPEGILSFYHKYQTDSLYDGCIIEISYDYGLSWNNILDDDIHIDNHFTGLYSDTDTIIGGIPAFSGSTSEWIYTEFHWRWMALTKSSNSEQTGYPVLRFRFVSDDVDSGKDGWVINRIVFRGYDISGTVDERINSIANVYPNPFNETLKVEISKEIDDLVFTLYRISGKIVIRKAIVIDQEFNLSDLSFGIYYYSIRSGDIILQTGKIIK